ncbi:MAG: PAS domain S-box protein [Tepidisphaeraceae bacterium]
MPFREFVNRSGGIEATGPGVLLVDLDHRIVFANPALATMLGYEPTELIGKTFEDITHPLDVKLDSQLGKRLFTGELDSIEIEKRYISKSGAAVPVLLTSRIIRDRAGEPLYGLGIAELRRKSEVSDGAPKSEDADADRIRRAILD